MGFLSSIGSFISGAASAIGAIASTAVHVVGTVARAAGRVVREVAGAALVFMGECGEAIIGGVKRVWSAARPYVSLVRAALQSVAAHASVHWIGVVALGLDRTLDFLTRFERSPVAHAIEAVLNWMIRKGKEIKERAQHGDFVDANVTEAAEAEQHGETLRIGMSGLPEERQHELRTAAMFTDLYSVSGRLNELLENTKVVKNFDFFLRVRAVQKLIKGLYNKVAGAKETHAITDDDHFLASISRELINKRTELTPEEAARLDRILTERTGMRLDVFVLEELVPVFRARHGELDAQWNAYNTEHAEAGSRIDLLNAGKLMAYNSKLSDAEEVELTDLQAKVAALNVAMEETRKKREFALACAGAAEGLVQLLERPVESLTEEELIFQQSEVEYICPLLRKSFENPEAWNFFTRAQQTRLTEYALRHLEALKRRIVTLQT